MFRNHRRGLVSLVVASCVLGVASCTQILGDFAVSSDAGGVEQKDGSVEDASVDSAIMDSARLDSTIPDSTIPDSAIPDSAIPDSAVDARRFCEQFSGTLFCVDFDDIDAGPNGGFLTRVEVQGGTVSLSNIDPKSPPRALRAQGLAVGPPNSSLAQLSAILPTNGVPHLSIELDMRLEGTPSAHQTIQLVELLSAASSDPFIALVDDSESGWAVSFTGGPTPVFVNLPTPANIGAWFHVAIDLTLGSGDAGSVRVALAEHLAQSSGIHTSPNDAGAAGNINLNVGVDSYGSSAIDPASPPFVVHIDNVVVRQ